MSALVELKRGGGDQVFIWFMVGMCAFLIAMFGFAGWAVFDEDPEIGAVLIAFALPFVGLGYYVYREAVARSLTRIAINWQTLELRLPRERGYVPQEKIDTAIPLASIKAIESRAESYRQIGTTALQFAYSLVLEDGRRIFLGADRRFLTPYFQNAAGIISNNIKSPIRDLGLVDGNPGFLLVTGQSAPPWDAAPVPPATMRKRFKDEASGWRIAWLITSAALAIGMIARAFGS
ncbi:MAG: hypothetical protein JNL81_09280 [Hyphomonadaceae bacterium]|nr:hypothetical protein [Hyphomonadaceae bacterium]